MPAQPNYLLRYPDLRQTVFPQVLRVYNGFEPGHASIDLYSGMELNIENAYYQTGFSRRGLDGFLGTETAQYRLRKRGGLQLLSTRHMQDRPGDQVPVEDLISAAEQRQECFRFYYEIFFKTAGRSRGSVLLSGKSREEIETIASQLMRNPDSVCDARSRNCTVFPEACSVSIAMEVMVNGSPQSVIWGSVLSDVAERPQHLELQRLYHGHLMPVRINSGDAEALRLPLLPGDRVSWR